MACFHPRNVVRSLRVRHIDSGKPVVFFKKSAAKMYAFWTSSRRHFRFYKPEVFQVPGCKPKCVGCIEDKSRDWAVRAWHESMMHDENCFITLTFSDKFNPIGLDHSIWQRFMKRFRRSISQPVSFFMAGEYGSLNFRPHFHACIFGFDFPDRVPWSVRDNVTLYTSVMLDKLWSDPVTGESYGFSSVGDVTFESAAYIARYVGKKAARSLEQLPGLRPEYSKCSLKVPSVVPGNKPGGIGKNWFYKFKDSVVYDDAVTLLKGGKCKPPRYYDKRYEVENPVHYAKIKDMRKLKASLSKDNTPDRLRAREDVKKAQFSQLTRSL